MASHGVRYTLQTPQGKKIIFNEDDVGDNQFKIDAVTGLDGADLRTNVKDRPQKHGVIMGRSLRGGLHPVIEGRFISSSPIARDWMETDLKEAAAHMLDRDAELTWAPPGAQGEPRVNLFINPGGGSGPTIRYVSHNNQDTSPPEITQPSEWSGVSGPPCTELYIQRDDLAQIGMLTGNDGVANHTKVTPGGYYAARFKGRVDALVTVQAAGINLYWFDEDDVFIGLTTGPFKQPAIFQEYDLGIIAQAPANAAYLHIGQVFNPPGTGGWGVRMKWDDHAVFYMGDEWKGATGLATNIADVPEYLDGNQPRSGWYSTPESSESFYDPRRRIAVRLNERLDIQGEFIKQFQLPLIAQKPWPESTFIREEDTSPVTGGGGGGVTFPVEFPIVFSGTSADGGGLFFNDGEIDTYPIIQIHGQITSPTIHNVTTDQVITLGADGGLVIPVGHYAEIDTFEETIYLDGDINTPLMNYLTVEWSEFFPLVPGENHIRLLGSAAEEASARASIIWRHAYA